MNGSCQFKHVLVVYNVTSTEIGDYNSMNATFLIAYLTEYLWITTFIQNVFHTLNVNVNWVWGGIRTTVSTTDKPAAVDGNQPHTAVLVPSATRWFWNRQHCSFRTNVRIVCCGLWQQLLIGFEPHRKEGWEKELSVMSRKTNKIIRLKYFFLLMTRTLFFFIKKKRRTAYLRSYCAPLPLCFMQLTINK